MGNCFLLFISNCCYTQGTHCSNVVIKKEKSKLRTVNTRQRLAFVYLNSTVVPSISSVTLTAIAVALINASSYKKKNKTKNSKKTITLSLSITHYIIQVHSVTLLLKEMLVPETNFFSLFCTKKALFCTTRGLFIGVASTDVGLWTMI